MRSSPSTPATGERSEPGGLPQRPGGVEVPVPGDPLTRPHRHRSGTMGHPMEGSAQRLRHHLRGTHQPLGQLGMPVASYTGNLTVPGRPDSRVRQSCRCGNRQSSVHLDNRLRPHQPRVVVPGQQPGQGGRDVRRGRLLPGARLRARAAGRPGGPQHHPREVRHAAWPVD